MGVASSQNFPGAYFAPPFYKSCLRPWTNYIRTPRAGRPLVWLQTRLTSVENEHNGPIHANSMLFWNKVYKQSKEKSSNLQFQGMAHDFQNLQCQNIVNFKELLNIVSKRIRILYTRSGLNIQWNEHSYRKRCLANVIALFQISWLGGVHTTEKKLYHNYDIADDWTIKSKWLAPNHAQPIFYAGKMLQPTFLAPYTHSHCCQCHLLW